MSTIGERLKEERERVGMTIPAFAEMAGAKKNTVIDWQKDVSSPPAAKLAGLADAGVDLLYILTGERSGVAAKAAMPADINKTRLQDSVEAMLTIRQMYLERGDTLSAASWSKVVLEIYDILSQGNKLSKSEIVNFYKHAS